MEERDYRRDALRIFFIILAGSSEFKDPAYTQYDRVFAGESRLQALDFWVRYPDYLADEMLSQYEKGHDVSLLAQARAIFEKEEPSLRKIPMLRRYFGAYEPLDTSLGILKSRGLVLPRTRKAMDGKSNHDFLTGAFSRKKRDEIVSAFPTLEWYRARTELVLKVANGRGGFDLKKRQHAQKEYHEAQTGDLIPTIAQRVLKRLEALEELA
ncbi:hypothetical protein HFO38_24300 [Rhizobium leguminosarum]|uniref:hypothetical protein n=1 Tax=Rhizobium leguminosarum TaxID=384 RepID=UPI001C972309|nr:hypothetical protein [Rhizobium leguminosarum]MBY5705799.1 hypothetical protein [Rhizobium leguminosarum]